LLARGDTVDFAGLGAALHTPILSADEQRQARWLTADFRRGGEVDAAIEQSRPDVVFHLAGISFPPDADLDAEATYEVNVLGAVRLFDSIGRRRAAGVIDPVVIVVGSGVQYGRHDTSEMPLREEAALRPETVYAATKTAQEIAALQAFRRSGLRAICTRSFNHSGPGHERRYLLPSLVNRVQQIRGGSEPRLTLGNDVVRDYLHVSDVVTAYLLLAERGRAGEVYNVASGRGVSVRELASDVLLRAGTTAEISTDPALVRASDIPTLVGSSARLQRDTGWAPAKTHADIIDDLLHSANAATD
jgi:GDP-4-dehydro-6-deoxy-D-mannose reductase